MKRLPLCLATLACAVLPAPALAAKPKLLMSWAETQAARVVPLPSCPQVRIIASIPQRTDPRWANAPYDLRNVQGWIIPGTACTVWLSRHWMNYWRGRPSDLCHTLAHERAHLARGNRLFDNPADPYHDPNPTSLLHWTAGRLPSTCKARTRGRVQHPAAPAGNDLDFNFPN